MPQAPKRSEERRRRNKTSDGGLTTIKVGEKQARDAGVDLQPTPPPPDERWDERVVDLYESLKVSPGVIFMYAADWEVARHVCEQLDRAIKPQFVGFEDHWNSEADRMEHIAVRERIPMNGSQFSALMKALNQLGLTEEARRRMHFEAPPLEVGPEFEQDDAADAGTGVVSDFHVAQASRRQQMLGGQQS